MNTAPFFKFFTNTVDGAQYLGYSVVHMVELDLQTMPLGTADRHLLLHKSNFVPDDSIEAGSIANVSIRLCTRVLDNARSVHMYRFDMPWQAARGMAYLP